jgi:hypothetical protein
VSRGPKSASRSQIHHDPGSPVQPCKAELPARSGCRRLRGDSLGRRRTGAKQPNPGCVDRSKARSGPPMPARRPPTGPEATSAKDDAAFNTHSLGGGGSGLAQHVFRSPARIQQRIPNGRVCAPRRQAKNALRYHAQHYPERGRGLCRFVVYLAGSVGGVSGEVGEVRPVPLGRSWITGHSEGSSGPHNSHGPQRVSMRSKRCTEDFASYRT